MGACVGLAVVIVLAALGIGTMGYALVKDWRDELEEAAASRERRRWQDLYPNSEWPDDE